MGLTRTRVRVEGIVQGVGFRPFVHALAGRLGLAGLVGNDAGGGFVEVEGAARLREGAVVAVKGLGGYPLAADAAAEPAVAALRARKHREDKPFAVMVADLEAARALGQVDPAEEALLASPRRPIVLLR